LETIPEQCNRITVSGGEFVGTKIVFSWNKKEKTIIEETVFAGDENKTLLFMANQARTFMAPYVPELNHMLVKAVNLSVEGGQGIVHYVVPYARYQWGGKLMVSSITGSSWSHGESKVLTNKDLNYTKPLATSHWDQAMRIARGDDLTKAVQNFIKQKGG
jgi:hypothetical protein